MLCLGSLEANAHVPLLTLVKSRASGVAGVPMGGSGRHAQPTLEGVHGYSRELPLGIDVRGTGVHGGRFSLCQSGLDALECREGV